MILFAAYTATNTLNGPDNPPILPFLGEGVSTTVFSPPESTLQSASRSVQPFSAWFMYLCRSVSAVVGLLSWCFFLLQERNQLSIQLTNLQVDFDNVNARLEEETENATSLRSQLQKAVADYQTLKSRFDKELIAKTEELEEIRFKTSSGGPMILKKEGRIRNLGTNTHQVPGTELLAEIIKRCPGCPSENGHLWRGFGS